MHEAVAVAVHLQDVDVVGEAVQQGTGEAFRAKHFGPLVEGEVGGDQDGSPFVALAEDIEEEFRAGGGQGDEAQFVDDQQAEAGQIPLQVEQPSLVLGLQQFRFTPFSPARRPSAVTQPVYFSTMALLDRRACRMVAESGASTRGPAPDGRHGWKQPCLRPRLGIPPCRSSEGGWKTRFISPWQDGILLPIPARGAAG